MKTNTKTTNLPIYSSLGKITFYSEINIPLQNGIFTFFSCINVKHVIRSKPNENIVIYEHDLDTNQDFTKNVN